MLGHCACVSTQIDPQSVVNVLPDSSQSVTCCIGVTSFFTWAAAGKIMAALKANDVQISVVTQSSGGAKQFTVTVEEITERIVQEYLLALG